MKLDTFKNNDFHLSLRPPSNDSHALLHPHPHPSSPLLLARLLQWPQTPRARDLFLLPCYPSHRVTQRRTLPSSPAPQLPKQAMIHPPSAIRHLESSQSTPARCSHAAAGMPKPKQNGISWPVREASNQILLSSSLFHSRGPSNSSVVPARIALLPVTCLLLSRLTTTTTTATPTPRCFQTTQLPSPYRIVRQRRTGELDKRSSQLIVFYLI